MFSALLYSIYCLCILYFQLFASYSLCSQLFDDVARCDVAANLRRPSNVVTCVFRQHTPNRVAHATSLDAIARRQCFRSGFPTVSVCKFLF